MIGLLSGGRLATLMSVLASFAWTYGAAAFAISARKAKV
jgi:hypothetical protein